jgi:hypothetical protein
MARPGGHPLLEILLRFVRRELSPLLHEQVEDHVRDCQQCKAKIAQNLYRARAA